MAKASTASQKFVEIKDIKENVVLLKSGQLCSVMLASSINFALKSQDEQQAVLFQFQQFLNTIDFSLQFYVQSRRLNIEPYLAQLRGLSKQQPNDLMRIQLREYIEFVNTFTSEVAIMSKSFFVVVPYTPSPIDIKQGLSNALTKQNTVTSTNSSFAEQRVQLEQRTAIVEEGLGRIGIRTVALQTDELVEFFYHIYNPGDPTGSAPRTGNA
jgi:type IV secretory pathway VirB4 component